MTSHSLILRTKKRIPLTREDVFEIINSHLIKRGHPDSVIEVEVVGKTKISSLNQKYLSKHGPTDVLSFPLERVPGEKNNLIGTIVLCSDIISSEAKTNGTTYSQEFGLKLTHGLDHLLGKHHK